MSSRLIMIITTALMSLSAQAEERLTLGVFPYFDPANLAGLHKPLAEQFAKGAATPVRLVSAPSFKAFKQRTAQGRYDILVTAPHLGRSADKKHGYQWLAFTSNRSHAVFVARKDSGITGIEQLRGKTLALPPKPAIIHHMALSQLRDAGLRPGIDVELKILKSHNNAMLTALRGDTDAAAFGLPTWRRYKAPDKEQLHEIGASEKIPGFAIMVHARVPEALRDKLRSALFRFPETSSGKAYFNNTGLEGVRDTDPADMALLDRYLGLIAKALADSNKR